MRTSHDLLPVYNELYDLKLDRKELVGIKKDLELTNNVYLKCVMHREGHVITLNNRGSYYYSSDEISLSPTSDVRDAKLNPKYYRSTRKENYIFNWSISKEEAELVSFISHWCQDIKEVKNEKDMIIFNNIDDFKTHVINKILKNRMHLGSSIETRDLKHFADLTDSFYDENKSQPCLNEPLETLGIILEVYTVGNIRVAQVEVGDGSLGILSLEHTHAAYNFIDVGRKFFLHYDLTSRYHWRRDSEITKKIPLVYLLDDSVQIPSTHKITDSLIDNLIPKNTPQLVDNRRIDLEIRRYDRRLSLRKKKEDNKVKVRNKLDKTVKSVKDGKKPFKYNEVTFTQAGIEYENQKLTCSTHTGGDILEGIIRYRNLDDINFDRAVDDFESKIQYNVECYLDAKGIVGDVDYDLTFEKKQNSLGNQYVVTRINGIKVNRDEVPEILRRGLCFTNQSAYDEFLDSARKCSLKIHAYLANGIHINVHDQFKGTYIDCKIPLVRHKNKNYIKLGDSEFHVSNTNRLVRLDKAQDVSEVINVLLNPDIVKVSGPDDIGFIIKRGEEEYKEAIRKSNELLSETEKLFGLEKEDHYIDGEHLVGYRIKGSIREYFLAVDLRQGTGSYCRVYEYPDMKYLCVVDKGVDQNINIDKVVQRIYALHNDSLVSEEVTTLNQN